MSADNRSTHTDALATLGSIIGPNERRDAIHLAVEPVIAAEDIWPGDDVALVDGIAYNARKEKERKPVGICDPFLKGHVSKGDRFWLVVYPRQITSLRHVWVHPDFPTPPEIKDVPITDKTVSELWIRNFIKNNDCPDYDVLIAAATGKKLPQGDSDGGVIYDNDGEYLYFGGTDAHGDIPDELWHHIEVVTGEKIESRPKYFSCSC